MADVGVYIKNANIKARCGVYANALASVDTETDKYVLDVEALINAKTNYDWSAWFVGAGAANIYRYLLKEAGASYCAIKVINADKSAFSTEQEAANMILTLQKNYDEAIRQLMDQNTRILMGVI